MRPHQTAEQTGGTDEAVFPNRGRRVSLRYRLMGLVALGMLLLMGERVGGILSDRAEKLDAIRQHVLTLTDRGMSQYRETLAGVRGVLQALSLDPAIAATLPTACSRFEHLIEIAPEVASLSVVNSDGLVVCSTTSAAWALDLSDREYIRIAQRGLFSLSSVVRNYITNAPSIFAAQPMIDDNGDITGVLVARIELDLLFPLSVISDLDLDAAVMMIDPGGTVIMSYPDPDRSVGHDLSGSTLVSYMLGRSSGSITAAGPDGERRIYGFERLPESNIRLAVGVDAAQLTMQVEQAAQRAALIFVAACALLFIGLWFAGERLVVRPIQSFAARLASFGRGERDAPSEPATRIIELEPLAAAFNAMAQQLTRREEALRSANRKLDVLASRDALTGVPNRRAFDQALALRWHDGTERLAMLMIDIDNFKQFNDRYGHGEGDSCLRRVAAALAASTRGGDIVARIGGEEFAVLMPGADANVATDVANRLRVTIENLDIRHDAAASGRVTVSVGCAACEPALGIRPADLMAAADSALYSAKEAGRNAVRPAEVTPQDLPPRRNAV